MKLFDSLQKMPLLTIACALISFLIFFSSFHISYQSFNKKNQSLFHHQSELLHKHIYHSIQITLTRHQAMVAFYNSSEMVTEDEFYNFSYHIKALGDTLTAAHYWKASSDLNTPKTLNTYSHIFNAENVSNKALNQLLSELDDILIIARD